MIFDSMLRNLDNVFDKFLMYPRFIQTFFDKQLDGLPTHKEKYNVSFHTKKDFANMKRIGKGFFGKETPLFPTMVGPNQEQMCKGSAQPTDTQQIPTIDMPPPKLKNLGILRERPLSLEVERDSGNIAMTKTKAKSNESSTQGTSLGDGPRRQDTMEDTSAHTRYERVSKISSDSLLAGVNTRQSNEDSLKHIELMKICTTLQKIFLDQKDELKRTKTAQQTKIDGLERRVKKLEKKHRSRTHKLKRLYKVGLTSKVISSFNDEDLDKEDTSKQGRIDEIDADEEITLVSTHVDVSSQDNIVQDEGLEDVGEVVTTAKMIIDVVVDAAQVTTAIADIPVSAAETLVTTALTVTVESTKTNVELLHNNIGFRTKVKGREKRKFFAVKRNEEKRNRPPTKAQQRILMCAYLKTMDRWKPKALKNKSFDEIQELFDKAMKRINTFVDFRTELVEESIKKDEAETTQESSSKREGGKLKQERSKKQNVEDDKASEELKQCLEIIPDDGDTLTIDATPLSSKSPTIVDYKIYKKGKKTYFQIFKADGNSRMYLTFSKLLKNFDKEDLEVLWRLVKDRFIKTTQVDHMDSFLIHNLKTMFEHHVKDNV
uniref:Uncharacterized protein n=1 Tax=Tanacetum cinerariifolium TaxID=118510 RepID=A0A6L2L8Y5_TANCI|nr:hypothetical protein [Tanacetum cinerariifolium]